MSGNPEGLRAIQYLLVLLAAAGVGMVSHFFDASPPELTFLKVTMVPVMALASYGVQALFNFEEAYRRWTGAMAARVGLTSLVVASSVTLLLSRAESALGELIWFFVSMFVIVALVAVFGPLAKRRHEP